MNYVFVRALPINLNWVVGFVGCIPCTMVRRAHLTLKFIGYNSVEHSVLIRLSPKHTTGSVP